VMRMMRQRESFYRIFIAIMRFLKFIRDME
jgi:hypothetical protein